MSETPPPADSGEKFPELTLESEMRTSYLNYSMSVICSRALPDIRDGLKPSQRRILVAMNDLNLGPRAKFRKCAKVVGDTTGNYHPHGDAAVYPTLVGMAQPFTTRYPLVLSQGNFGAIDGSPPAAMRYTECKMGFPAAYMLEDLDQDTVDLVDNYDGVRKEPSVLPGRFPNLLCNGSYGIAVGMATSLPPHNFLEIAGALKALLADPEVTLDELLRHVKGPDFPTGGTIMGRQGMLNAYRSGRGSVIVRSEYKIEERGNRKQIVFTEIPYQVKVNTILERITQLAKTGQIDTIADINDETNDRVGLRIVVELKRGIDDPSVTLNQLFKLTPLQSRFSIINLAIQSGQPVTLGLKGLLEAYREHRIDVITRRTRFLLAKAEARLHVIEGLRIAVQNIDDVVEIIKKSESPDHARGRLQAKFGLSEIQARAILDMRLARLTGLEIDKLESEYQEVKGNITYYNTILNDRQVLIGLIRTDIEEMEKTLGDVRRTRLSDEEIGTFVDEDLIAEELMVVTSTHHGYIKRTALDQYRTQGRGGKGIQAGDTKEGDFLQQLFVANTHDYFLFFSDRGRVYWRKVHQLPLFGRTARGRALVNLIQTQVEGERIHQMLRVENFDDRFVLTATAKGLIKKTALSAYSRPKRGGIIAVGLEEDDRLIGVGLCRAGQSVMLGTRDGMAIRFSEQAVRAMGRSARGVRAIKLRAGDEVVDMVIGDEAQTLLTVCEKGYGKRTSMVEYRAQARGGLGMIDIRTTDRNGKVVNLLAVTDDDEVMMVTMKGQIVRTPAREISVIGRATQGVRCIKLADDDRVVAVARVPQDEPSESAEGSPGQARP